MNVHVLYIVGIGISLLSGVAGSATVSIYPPFVNAGSCGSSECPFSVDVVIDFSDDPTIGGSVDVTWNATDFRFIAVDFNTSDVGDDPDLRRYPDVDEDQGLLSGIAIGNIDGIAGPGIAFSLLFEAPGSGFQSLITIRDTLDPTLSPWQSFADGTVQFPEYSGATVFSEEVPVPGALWLLGAALLSLASRRGSPLKEAAELQSKGVEPPNIQMQRTVTGIRSFFATARGR